MASFARWFSQKTELRTKLYTRVYVARNAMRPRVNRTRYTSLKRMPPLLISSLFLSSSFARSSFSSGKFCNLGRKGGEEEKEGGKKERASAISRRLDDYYADRVIFLFSDRLIVLIKRIAVLE